MGTAKPDGLRFCRSLLCVSDKMCNFAEIEENNEKEYYMVSIDGLAVEFGGSTLFSDISFVINEKDRIALMGKNGAGKSTLLKILAGVRKPTRGNVSAPKDTVIAYLPQHLMTEDGRTVFEEASQAFAHLHQMEAEIEVLN